MGRKRKTSEQFDNELFEKEIDVIRIGEYTTGETRTLFECIKGHQWIAAPRHILAGRGCPICAGNVKRTTASYVQELIDKDIVYRPLEEYKATDTTILHVCPEGHKWTTTPIRILQGRGCPKCKCKGIQYNEPGILYLVSLEFDEIQYYKLGITTRTVRERYAEEWNKLQMKLIWELQYNTALAAFRKEQELLVENSCYLVNMPILKKGNSEILTVKVKEPVN